MFSRIRAVPFAALLSVVAIVAPSVSADPCEPEGSHFMYMVYEKGDAPRVHQELASSGLTTVVEGVHRRWFKKHIRRLVTGAPSQFEAVTANLGSRLIESREVSSVRIDLAWRYAAQTWVPEGAVPEWPRKPTQRFLLTYFQDHTVQIGHETEHEMPVEALVGIIRTLRSDPREVVLPMTPSRREDHAVTAVEWHVTLPFDVEPVFQEVWSKGRISAD